MITLTIIVSILVVVLLFGISALIFWGIGNLVIWVFGISYVWTFWHGLVCALVFVLLKDIFGGKNDRVNCRTIK